LPRANKPYRLLKKLPSLLQEHINNKANEFSSFNLYFQDESRFGLFTRNGKSLTAKGIKPICLYHHKFESTYLFGAFSPISGDSLLLDLPSCNTDMFQIFLDELAKKNPEEYKIIILDNGAFHKARKLQIPHNIGLIFLPPYSPELNPAEKIWWLLKKQINNKVFKTMEELQTAMEHSIAAKLTAQQIKSSTGYQFYLNAFRTTMNF
jgi:transposase